MFAISLSLSEYLQNMLIEKNRSLEIGNNTILWIFKMLQNEPLVANFRFELSEVEVFMILAILMNW